MHMYETGPSLAELDDRLDHTTIMHRMHGIVKLFVAEHLANLVDWEFPILVHLNELRDVFRRVAVSLA